MYNNNNNNKYLLLFVLFLLLNYNFLYATKNHQMPKQFLILLNIQMLKKLSCDYTMKYN